MYEKVCNRVKEITTTPMFYYFQRRTANLAAATPGGSTGGAYPTLYSRSRTKISHLKMVTRFSVLQCVFALFLCFALQKKLPTNATTSQRFPLISILFCFSFCVFCCFTSFFLSFHSFIIHPNATLKFFLRYCVTFMLLLFSLLSLFFFPVDSILLLILTSTP